MAKLGSLPQHSAHGQSDVVVSLCSLGVVLCMVIAVLGIKFRWFKKRIHFDQIPESSGSGENGQVILRRSSRNFQEQFSEPVVAQGIFRRKLDEDIIIERPKTLPPVRVRKTSKSLTIFGPPKRNQVPSTVVEEPVVIPPPPPPLPPSVSLVSLSNLVGASSQPAPTESKVNFAHTAQPALIEDKVNFAQSVEIIPNGNTNTETETEPLKTEDAPISRQLSGRKQTGYTRPSDEIIAELQKLSDEVTKQQNSEYEPPKPLPRTVSSEKPKEKFKKNISRPVKSSAEHHNSENEHADRKLGQRRLTGIFPSTDEDLGDYTDLSDDSDEQTPKKVIFQVELDDSGDERKSPPPLPIKSPPPMISPPMISPPILFITQVSNDEEEVESSDSWSAIQRHRNLTQEINDQQEVSTTKEELYSNPKVEHPITTQADQPKPRTMRDMKRNNARNDLLLNSERDYTDT